MKSNKTKYLSYIEDHRKHHSLIEEVAKKSTKIAISRLHEDSVPVTFLEGEEIVKIDSHGEKSTVGTIENNRRKVKVGAKSKLLKK